ncbi:enolase C-terminal domain-like protein [Marimonas lutisalis]|uniref:enolase C-terminal domain-like protein n=1 Tax=Marimonas lutisalis TaxID=2545756 RepID=UPI0010F6DD7D|nr:enolase C-terminal domain-like protein [Marimonas lutisalis]
MRESSKASILPTETKEQVSGVRLTSICLDTAYPALPTPLQTSSGSLEVAPLITIQVLTDCGIVGESYLFSPNQTLLPALSEAIKAVFQVVQNDPCLPETITDKVLQHFTLFGGTGIVTMAMAAIDMAVWDVVGKAVGKPLYRVLGGASPEVTTYESSGLGIGDPNTIRQQAESFLEDGNTIMKLRLGYDALTDDMQVLEMLTSAFGSSVQFLVDYNQGLTPREAATRCKEIDTFGLLWIEEPVRADLLEETAYLKAELQTPVQIGENLWSLAEVERALRLSASTYLMPDVGKIGGVTQWLRAATLADQYGVKISSHLYPEISGHLLAAIPNAHFVEYADWTANQFSGHTRPSDNRLKVSDQPGFGLSA